MSKKNTNDTAATAQPKTANKPASHRSVFAFLRDDLLFLASPIIALAYMVLFPFIGLAMLVKMARQARRARAASH